MPYVDKIEFDIFVRQNLFLAIKGTVKALKTVHLSYDDYFTLKKKNIEYNNLYSYSFYEYLVKDRISLDDVLFIGIDSQYFNGDYNKTISGVIELMDRYKIEKPFIDINNNVLIYQKHLRLFENKFFRKYVSYINEKNIYIVKRR